MNDDTDVTASAIAWSSAALGVWIGVSPLLIANDAFVLLNQTLGTLTVIASVGYAIHIRRERPAEPPSMWPTLAIGILLLLSTVVSTVPVGTVFFWNTVVSGALLALLGAASIVGVSRSPTGG